MKKLKYLLLTTFMLMSLVGCSSNNTTSTKNTNTTNKVSDVVESQTKKETNVSEEETSKNKEIEKEEKNTFENLYEYKEEDIDIDLSTMSSEMVYSTVYQAITTPNDYVGKVFKIKGTYDYTVIDNNTYDFILIADATACCSQGMEFILGDGNFNRDCFPNINDEITIIGKFETYEEGSDTYIHLVDTNMQIN